VTVRKRGLTDARVTITRFTVGCCWAEVPMSRIVPCILWERGTMRRRLLSRHHPFHCWMLLSYVTELSTLGQKEEDQAGIAPWYRQPNDHPFHWPTVRISGYSRVGLFRV